MPAPHQRSPRDQGGDPGQQPASRPATGQQARGHGGNVPIGAVPNLAAAPKLELMAPPTLPVTGDPDADALLVADPLALLIGLLLDQQAR